MKRFQKNAIKEAFDNLPSGICYFDKNGVLILCNHQMYRLLFALTGKDLQSLPELQADLMGDILGGRKENDIFLLDDGSALRFTQEQVVTQDGNVYTQVIASNVTELYRRRNELEQDNKRLKEYAERMRRLSANIITLIREEEILNMKMRVHDDIGRSVISARRFLQQNRPMEQLDLTVWKKAVQLLQHDTELLTEQDAIAELVSAAEGIGIKILLEGQLPEEAIASGLFITAIRECMTNAARHAGASELYVRLACEEKAAYAVITNDGVAPDSEVVEGGGLTSLRFRVEQYGGTMRVRHTPRFELTVSVPLGLEESI